MQKSLVILAFVILFKPLFPIVEYYVNYDYISKVLCVNKDNVIMGCDGKCYLVNELARMAKGEEPISEKKIMAKHLEVLFFEKIATVELPQAPGITTKANDSKYSNLYSYLNCSSAFHPPTSIV